MARPVSDEGVTAAPQFLRNHRDAVLPAFRKDRKHASAGEMPGNEILPKAQSGRIDTMTKTA